MLFPQPDGPTSETNVCPSISKLTLVIASTGPWPFTRGGKTFLTSFATNLATGQPSTVEPFSAFQQLC